MFFTRLINSFRGLRFRLTFVYSSLFGISLCIFAYIQTGQSLDASKKDFNDALLNHAIDLSEAMVFKGENEVDFAIGDMEKLKHFPFSLKNMIFILRKIDGEIITKHGPENFEIEFDMSLAQAPSYSHRFLSLKFQGVPYQAINLKLKQSGQSAFILQVATPSTILKEQRNRYLIVNMITIPLLILIASFLAYLITDNALTPLKNLITLTNSIAAKNLSLRIPEINSQDELGEISKTFNNLLERLEKSFKAQENFVANASHQLNTPLSIIKGELDVLESKTRTTNEINRFHSSLREEIQRLIELVQNMLLISRVEAGKESFHLIPVRMDELIMAEIARLNIKAKENNVYVRFDIDSSITESSQLIVSGEKQLLDCLFENLLDNAIKYSPANSTIRILLSLSSDQIQVVITDEGPGIDSKEYQKIISKRFQRGSQLPGTGIGLSIAHQIAEIHQAQIQFQNVVPHGSSFTITFSSP